jgi:sortase B
MKKVADAGNFIIRIITTVLAVIFLIYGGLMLWDMYRTEIKAFASYDLLKYRPNIEEDEPPYLDELLEINPDTAAWLTIYNTHMDYPVMHGKTDMEYINKDVYGEYTVTGSIFMASENSKDFSDPYTLVYGHHMTNGSMFGDIHKFKEKEFFDANDKGILIMENKAYDLKIMACLATDAYDEQVYQVKKTELEPFVSYVRENTKLFRETPYEQILVLSTCDDANTSGRTVLVCAMNTRTAPLPDREKGKATPARQAVGHPMAGAYWSLINLICLLTSVYFAIRIIWIQRKKLKSMYVLIEFMLAIVSILVFYITEDMKKPIQMVDIWTPLMLAILALIWLVARKECKDQRIPEQVKEEDAV